VYEQEILDAGYDTWPRNLTQSWYPATQDDEHFYYSANGGTLFGSYFGFGTSSVFICRRKKDAKLVWVRNSLIYRVDDPQQPNFFGTTNVLSRVTLAIYEDRLYVTCLITNIGPQLFCLDKQTGSPIWSIAYDIPDAMKIAVGQDTLGAPNDVPFNSFNGAPYTGASVNLGDLNVNVAKLAQNTVSVFVGVSSFQNAFNPSGFAGFAKYIDQGKLLRIEDNGAFGSLLWASNTCAPILKVGDVISNVGAPEFNPFRPGQNQVYIWREVTATGTFSAPGGVNAAILDYTGANPGYIPIGYPLQNNLTTPVITNVILLGGNPPLTEASVQNIFRSPAPGVGANAVLYWTRGGFVNPVTGPVNITAFLVSANALQAGLAPGGFLKLILWTYVNQATVTAVNAAAWGVSNSGARYIASLPTGYTIANDQEAEALNYFGNSVWGQSCTIDVQRNMVYHGTGQTHGGPVDELLTYQNPSIEYLDRKQNVIDNEYQYARPDSSTNMAPYSTLEDVNQAKDDFIIGQADLNLDYTLKSPRGNMSYADAILGVNLSTGKREFGYRLMPWDQMTFIADDPSNIVIQAGFYDTDVSSGIQLLENVTVTGENSGKRTFLATVHKGSILGTLDISGLNPGVVFDDTNLLEKGVVPKIVYAGPDGALGGSNYGLSQDGGSKLIWSDANDAAFIGSFSFTYNTGFYRGIEFHVTRDGRVFLPNVSYAAAYDLATQETAWETEIGQLTHSQVQSFNGVSFIPRGDGILMGLDNGTGKVIYKDDFFTPYGMKGIVPPVFNDQGEAVFINNYRLPVVGNAGDLGGKAVLLKVEPCKLVTPKDTIKSLVSNKEFNSFDVLPKAPNVIPQLQLRNDQTVQHLWGEDGLLHVKHTLTDFSGPNPVVTVLEADFDATDFVYFDQEIKFNNYPTQNGLRYISLTMMTRKKYDLVFQIINGDQVTNYLATLKLKKSDYKPCQEKSKVVTKEVTELSAQKKALLDRLENPLENMKLLAERRKLFKR